MREEWARIALGGLAALALVGSFEPSSLAGALPVWAWCCFLLKRALPENRSEGQDELLPTLGAPNWITMLRALLIAVSAGFLPVPPVAAPAYSAAALLDNLDGRLARRLARETRLGEKLDMEVDAVGILVASLAGIALGKLPLWYLSVGLARYLFVAGIWLRTLSGTSGQELDRSGARRLLAGGQMGFLAVVLWPQVPAELSLAASPLFGGATLAMFARDFFFVQSRPTPSASATRLM
jgi:CDP-diacylglycerol--glycerol-3-phosphate 3-phosphatidyltransferase